MDEDGHDFCCRVDAGRVLLPAAGPYSADGEGADAAAQSLVYGCFAGYIDLLYPGRAHHQFDSSPDESRYSQPGIDGADDCAGNTGAGRAYLANTFAFPSAAAFFWDVAARSNGSH